MRIERTIDLSKVTAALAIDVDFKDVEERFNLDGDILTSTKRKLVREEEMTITAKANGKVFKSTHVTAPGDLGYWDGTIRFGNPDDIKALQKAVAEALAEAEKAEWELLRKNGEEPDDVKEARRKVEQAEKQKQILPRKEIEKMVRNYRNLYNEGGSGYVPDYGVSLEAYNEAKRVIGEWEK